MSGTRITGAYVYDTETKRFRASDFEFDHGMICQPGTLSDPKILHLNGQYLIPGLVDVHTHGRAGSDFNRMPASIAENVLRSYALAGTTSIMATLASDTLEGIRNSIHTIAGLRSHPIKGCARILGTHLEGIYLSPEKRGAHNEKLLRKPEPDEISSLVKLMKPAPVHVSMAPELEGGIEAILRLKNEGATVGIAHSNADAETTRKALDAGADSFTHLFNCTRTLHHREPGNTGIALVCDAYTEIICDGLHLNPEIVKLVSLAKDLDKIVLITDSMEAAGCPDGEYAIGGLPVTVKNGKALTHEGAIAGSLLNLFDSLLNFTQFSGRMLCETIVCATSNPASMIGASQLAGSLRPGMPADFLVLDSATILPRRKPHLLAVSCAGEWLQIQTK